MSAVLPRLRAIFRPQHREGDHTVREEKTQEFDVTYSLVCRAHNGASIRFWQFPLDAPPDVGYLTGVFGQPDGISELEIAKNEWEQFWKANGVANWRKITDEELRLAQARYACPPTEDACG